MNASSAVFAKIRTLPLSQILVAFSVSDSKTVYVYTYSNKESFKTVNEIGNIIIFSAHIHISYRVRPY